jgi:co-chaperonin GroES (HSP10)
MTATIKPLGHNVMFRFLDDTGGAKGRFHDTHHLGIILMPTVNSQKVNRWGEVIAVGPLVDGLAPGDYILVENLMWMEGNVVDGQKMWKTDDQKVLAVTNDIESCERQ